MYKKQFINNIVSIFIYALICSVVFILMRFQEAYFLESKMYYQFKASEYLVNTSFYDLKVCLSLSVLLIPLAFFKKNINFISLFFFTILILANSILIQYFLSNLMLLGSEMLTFSNKELIYIIKNEFSSYGIFQYILLFFHPILFLFVSFNIKTPNKALFKNLLLIIYFVFLIITAFEYKYFIPNYMSFKSYHEFLINNNKIVFYISDLVKKNNSDKKVKITRNLKKDIQLYQTANNKFDYTNTQYPLMHNTPYENVLGAYFPKDSIKPNIVFIMVEGLARSFCGPDAHLGSFTPFLDSLIDKSLFWNNFISNAERTYGVLPNILSSAPYMKQFIQQKSFINHNSIISELNSEYQTNFNYGGWANFSNMESLLKFNHIDEINSELNFDTTYFKKHLSTENDFHWGYDDGALFKQFLIHSQQFKEPYLSILLTISMHSPWDVSQDYSLEDAITHLGQSTQYQKDLLSSQTDIVKSIIFFDNKLEEFFNEYKKRADFKNTIFIITGDHNMHSLPEKNEIDAFHVPLIIYSELLKETKSFKGVCSHRDITPTLLGLLEQNFNMKFTVDKNWLGLSLDTSILYQNKQITPLVMGSNSFACFMNKNNIVIRDKVFVLDENFEIHIENDSSKIIETLEIYNAYQNIESYMLSLDKLYRKN